MQSRFCTCAAAGAIAFSASLIARSLTKARWKRCVPVVVVLIVPREGGGEVIMRENCDNNYKTIDRVLHTLEMNIGRNNGLVADNSNRW